MQSGVKSVGYGAPSNSSRLQGHTRGQRSYLRVQSCLEVYTPFLITVDTSINSADIFFPESEWWTVV